MAVKDALLNRIVGLIDQDITHIGLGIPNEVIRKAATSFIDGTTLIKEVYFDDTEVNGNSYTQIEVFGNGATDTLGTGEIMIDETVNISKDNTQSLTVSCEITVETV